VKIRLVEDELDGLDGERVVAELSAVSISAGALTFRAEVAHEFDELRSALRLFQRASKRGLDARVVAALEPRERLARKVIGDLACRWRV
jgi:hypothetical protein